MGSLVLDVLDTYKENNVGHWKCKSRFLGKAEARNKLSRRLPIKRKKEGLRPEARRGINKANRERVSAS